MAPNAQQTGVGLVPTFDGHAERMQKVSRIILESALARVPNIRKSRDLRRLVEELDEEARRLEAEERGDEG